MTRRKNIPEADIRRAWLDLSTPLEVSAQRLGITRQGLAYHAGKLRLPPRSKSRYDLQKKCSDDEFRRLWKAGLQVDKIARVLGYSTRSGVNARRKALGLPPRKRVTGCGKPGGYIETVTMEDLFRIAMQRASVRENSAMKDRWAA